MKIKACLSIGRDSSGMIRIRIRDQSSRREFVDLGISAEGFGLAVTGMSEIECDAVVSGLGMVGMNKIQERRRIVCPINTYDKNVLADWLKKNCQEDGWQLIAYLGSQSSVAHCPDGVVLNYSVVRYEAQPNEGGGEE